MATVRSGTARVLQHVDGQRRAAKDVAEPPTARYARYNPPPTSRFPAGDGAPTAHTHQLTTRQMPALRR